MGNRIGGNQRTDDGPHKIEESLYSIISHRCALPLDVVGAFGITWTHIVLHTDSLNQDQANSGQDSITADNRNFYP